MKADCLHCNKLLPEDKIFFTYVSGWDMVAMCKDCYLKHTKKG